MRSLRKDLITLAREEVLSLTVEQRELWWLTAVKHLDGLEFGTIEFVGRNDGLWKWENGNRGTEESKSHVSSSAPSLFGSRSRSPDDRITEDNKEDPASTVHPHPRVIKESEDRETPYILIRRRTYHKRGRMISASREETEVVRSENSPLLDC